MINEDTQKKKLEKNLENPKLFLRSVENFPANFEHLELIRDFVGRQAETSGLNEQKIYEVQLAVDEAFTNIIEHAFGGECKEEILCSCEADEQSFAITLVDCGPPFNPATVPEPDINSSLEDRKIGGLGIYFIKKMMDEVHYSFKPSLDSKEGNNILRMVKYKDL